MRVAASIEGTDLFGDVHLVDGNDHLGRPLGLIFEPSVGHSQVKIASYFDGRISPEEDFPVIIDGFKDWGEVDVQLREILKAHGVEEDFYFLCLRVGDHLAGDVDSVRLVEDIESDMVGEVGVSDLLERGESDLDDVLDLSAGYLSGVGRTPGTLRMTSSTSIWQ